jgi:hypothetical protein
MPTTSLQQHLREAGYDLIDGPIRNHKPLQLWLKEGFNQPELYYANILHAFNSSKKLRITKDPGLDIKDTDKNEYAFQIGITMVQEWMQSIGMPPIDFSGAISGGKKVTISYRNAITEGIPTGDLTDFLSDADFLHPNPVLLRNANRNNLLVITGVVTAEQIVAEMETDSKINSKIINGLKKSASNKIEFSSTKSNTLRMVAGTGRFPVAVKANRIDFDKSRFNGLQLVTDGRDLF